VSGIFVWMFRESGRKNGFGRECWAHALQDGIAPVVDEDRAAVTDETPQNSTPKQPHDPPSKLRGQATLRAICELCRKNRLRNFDCA